MTAASTRPADEIAALDATAQAEQVQAGNVTAVELVEWAIERIERLNPQLNAVITPVFERAREEARRGPAGPFAGVPYLLKDLSPRMPVSRCTPGRRSCENGEFRDPHGFDAADGVRAEVRGYLTALHAQERANPTDGPVGHMFRVGMPDGEMRDVEYLLPSTLVLFLGGLQEPGHACGTTFLGLATRPDQLARVIADPQLLGKAIAEGLRWMSPLYGGASRTAARDLPLGGQQVRAGNRCLDAAERVGPTAAP